MEVERIIEKIDSDTLVLHNLSKYKGQEVEVIIIPFRNVKRSIEDIASEDLLRFAQDGGSFEFLNDTSEDIYTMADGSPLDD
jgi:hypothetical protein